MPGSRSAYCPAGSPLMWYTACRLRSWKRLSRPRSTAPSICEGGDHPRLLVEACSHWVFAHSADTGVCAPAGRQQATAEQPRGQGRATAPSDLADADVGVQLLRNLLKGALQLAGQRALQRAAAAEWFNPGQQMGTLCMAELRQSRAREAGNYRGTRCNS